VKLYGVFRSTARTPSLDLEIPNRSPTVRSAINTLVAQTGFRELKGLLMDEQSADPRPNALIMVSGREVSALGGLEAMMSEGDELALLPVAHGG